MANKWQRRSLREVGVTLIDCDHRTPLAANDGYPYVAIPQLKEGRIDFSTARRISPEDFADWTRKAKPQRYDVVLSRRCNPGETAYVTDGVEFALGQNLVILRADGKELFPPFLRWLVRSPDWWEQVNTFINVGAVFDSLKCADIPNFKMPIPPIEEQKEIAKILSSLDDKIELNRRMNATLEAMARALFKAWFVDFEPVHANKENRPSTSASPEIAKLFPSTFENGIPKGWHLGQVSDLGEIVCGKTPSTKIAANFGDEIPFITIPDMHGKAVITKTARYLSIRGAESQHKKYLPAHSICVSCIATAGLVSMTTERSQTNQQINSVIPNGKFGTYFCYQVLNKLGEEIRTKGSGGSVFVNLNTGSFSKIPVLLPDKTISTSYHKISKPLFEKIVNNEKEKHCLSEMRDSMLPRLVSGRIRVNK